MTEGKTLTVSSPLLYVVDYVMNVFFPHWEFYYFEFLIHKT